jgi:stage II sporulation protein D
LGISAADRRQLPTALLLVLAAGCIRDTRSGTLPAPGAATAAVPASDAEPRGDEPKVRIGLAVGSTRFALGGSAELRVSAPDGSLLARLPEGVVAEVVPHPGRLHLEAPRGVRADAPVLVISAAGGAVRLNGREYRGHAVLRRDAKGVTAVNVVGLEAYLAGVVGAELGTKDARDSEALRAQAIVARTYTLKNLGRRNADGFDLYAGVSDQVYAGIAAEAEPVRRAVRNTSGQVVMYQGALIDAFFFSTCGGRTAQGTEVFRNAARPYLRSIEDAPNGGPDWCSGAPRYRWRERWTGDVVARTLRHTLPAVARVAERDVEPVRDIRIGSTGPSGRVAELVLRLRDRDVRLDGPQARLVLRPAGTEPLRSAAFALATEHSGGRVSALVIEGRGNGHGVGFCQWGAIGRGRAGQSAPDIVAAYFPGTTITRLY